MATETLNYVVGFDQKNGCTVPGLEIDHSGPVTLKRCGQIFEKACTLSGRDLSSIHIHLSEFTVTPDNEDGEFPEKCIMNKEWIYTDKSNSLLIYDKGQPVYVNGNGTISSDRDALVDTLNDGAYEPSL